MKNKMMAMVVLVAGAWLLAAPAGRAQSAAKSDSPTVTDQDIQLLRQDLRSNKKQFIAANLKLTDAEATKFWPVYDQYAAEMTKLGDQKYALIKEYAQNFGTLNDAQAQTLLNRSLALDEATAQLRIKYVPIINKVLPGTKTATFFPNRSPAQHFDRLATGIANSPRATAKLNGNSRRAGPRNPRTMAQCSVVAPRIVQYSLAIREPGACAGLRKIRRALKCR